MKSHARRIVSVRKFRRELGQFPDSLGYDSFARGSDPGRALQRTENQARVYQSRVPISISTKRGWLLCSLPLILEVRAMQYLSLYRLLCRSTRRRYLETLKLDIYAVQ